MPSELDERPAEQPPPAQSSPRSPTRPGRWWAWDTPMAVAVVGSAALLVTGAWAGRNLWFFADEWNVYGDYPLGDLLKPFNGHLSLIPIGIYQSIYLTLGVDDYLWFRLAGLAALAVLAFTVLRYGRSRVGPWAGCFAVLAVMWNSAGSSDVLFPFLLNFTIPIAALFAIWWHLDRDSTGHDVAASVWLAVALWSSALGLMALAAVVVELAWSRATLRRWLLLCPGVVLWLLWYLTNREPTPLATDPLEIAEYAGRMYLGATTSLAAGWTPGGVVLAAAFVALVAVAGLRWRTLDGRALGALTAPGVFIVVTTLTRIPIVPYIPPDELRYRWAVAAYLVGAVLSLWRPGRIRLEPAVVTAVAIAAGLVLGVGSVRLVDGMGEWSTMVEKATPGVRANIFAAEAIGADRIDWDVVLPLSYVPVTTGDYLRGVREVGSPLATLDASGFGGSRDHRRSADMLLVSQLPIAAATGEGSCSPTRTEVTVEPGSTVVVGSPGGEVRVGRFTGRSDAPVLSVPSGTSLLEIPADASGTPSGAPPYRVWSDAPTLLCVEPSR